MSDLVTFAIYNSRVEAELVKGLLVANNIHALIMSDDEGGMMAYPFSLVKGVRILVSKQNVKKAKELLKGTAQKAE
jgi:hypothetical protein